MWDAALVRSAVSGARAVRERKTGTKRVGGHSHPARHDPHGYASFISGRQKCTNVVPTAKVLEGENTENAYFSSTVDDFIPQSKTFPPKAKKEKITSSKLNIELSITRNRRKCLDSRELHSCDEANVRI
jgi:hypothetical protein